MTDQPDIATIMQTAYDQSPITAAALIELATQDMGAALAKLGPLPAHVRDSFAFQGAQQALAEAYCTLAGQALAGCDEATIHQDIAFKLRLFADGICVFAKEATDQPEGGDNGRG